MRGKSTLRSQSVRATRSDRVRRPRVTAAATRAYPSLWAGACERLEDRRLLSVAISGSVTLDESPGLQAGVPAVSGEDNNDSDVAVGSLPSAFSNRLFGSPAAGLGLSNTFPTLVGVGKSADNYITVTAPGSTITSVGFSKADGSALPVYAGVATGGVASSLSAVSGGAIGLFADASLGNRMVVGVDGDNQIVLALFMEPNASLTSARVWTVQTEPLSNPDATNPDDPVTMAGLGVAAGSTIVFTFDQLHSGSNLFGTVGDTTNSLIVIAEHPLLKANGLLDTAGQAVKTSQGGTGATIGIDSQMIDPGEGAFFTYVKGSDPDVLAANLDQTEANDSAAIRYSGGTLAAASASVTISQTQGPTPGTMQISTFDVADSPQQKPFVDGITNGTGIGAAVAITSVTIFKANGTTVTEAAAGPNTSANISFAGGVATVSGLGSGDKIEWTTGALHDRVLIKGVAGKFDVGAFGVNEPNSHLAPLSGVRFEDDGPAIVGAAKLVALTVDETDLATNQTRAINPTVDFSATFGQDGANNTTFTFALGSVSGDSGLDDTATGLSVFLFNEGGSVVGRAGADASAAASGPVVFTLSVDSSGNLTLDQSRAVVHPDATNPDDSKTLLLSGVLVVTGTATDKDGDSASRTVNDDVLLTFEDDGPSITATAGGPTLTVDESDLATNATGGFAVQFSPTFGNDGAGATPVSYALSTPGGDSGLDDTASGLSVFLFKVGAQVVGKAGADATAAASGPIVFTVGVDGSGNVTLDQQRSIVHPDATNPDDSRTLASAGLVVLTATATDKDGDSASAPLNIGLQLVMEDDGPAIGPIASSIVDFAAGSSATKSLNGLIGADPKTGPYTVDSFTGSVTINGVELHGVASGNNTVVTYYADTGGNGIFGDAGDTPFYKLELNQTANSGAGSYTFTVLVNPPPSLLHFDFDELHSGSNLFGCVGDAANSLIVIAEKPKLKADGTLDSAGQAVKTSQGGTGATIGIDSQMIDPGEGAFFTYVKGSDPNFLAAALDQGEANDSAAIKYSGGTLATTSASVTISQTQGPTPGTMTIAAFDVAGSPQQEPFVDGIIDGTGVGAAVAVTSVTIFKANGTTVTEAAAGPNTSANISFAGGVATVSGLGSGDRIEWTTAALHDRVLIKGVAGKFDVGAFDITQAQPTPDQKLDFVVRVTDGDGDFATAGFSIGIDGTGIFDDGQVGGVSASLFSSTPILA